MRRTIRLTRTIIPNRREQRGVSTGFWLIFAGLCVIIFAMSARGQNFRAADQVYLPAAGHVAGQDATFLTDIWIKNTTTDSVSVSILFIPDNSAPNVMRFSNVVTLRPGENHKEVDVVGALLHVSGAGMLVSNGCLAGADCTPDPTTGENVNYRNVSVESRTYTSTKCGGTVGQDMPGISWRFTASQLIPGMDTLLIVGLRDRILGDAGWRTNIGVANASEYATINLILALIDGLSGAELGVTYVSLKPLESRQQSVAVLFPNIPQLGSRLNRTAAGVPILSPYVRITQSGSIPTADAAAHGCAGGCPAFIAYGSLIDNASGDATTLEAQFATEGSPAYFGAPATQQ